MRKLLAFSVVFTILGIGAIIANGRPYSSTLGGPVVLISEEDGDPISRLRLLQVPNDSLTDNGGGTLSLDTSSGDANAADVAASTNSLAVAISTTGVAVLKNAVDISTTGAAIDTKVSKDGDTMTGNLNLVSASMTIVNGTISIGTTTPRGEIFIMSPGAPSITVVGVSDFSGVSPVVNFRRGSGENINDMAAALNNNVLMFLGAAGIDERGTLAIGSDAAIKMIASEDITSSANGTRITFETTDIGSTSRVERFSIEPDGKVIMVNGAEIRSVLILEERYDVGDQLDDIAISTTNPTISDGSVTTAKLADDSVTSAKLFRQPESLLKVSGGVMTSDGTNIGIGTASPAQALDVVGSITVSNDFITEDDLLLGGVSAAIKWTGGRGDIESINEVTIDVDADNDDSNSFFRITKDGKSVELMRIGSDGNMGIGDSSPTTAKLTVQLSEASQEGIRISSQNASVMFVVKKSGNVGVGTESPCSTCTLHVAGSASITGNIQVGDGGQIGNIDAGEYAAVVSTITNLENTATISANSSRFIRIGNQVTVVFQAVLDATASGDADTEAQVSLPFASNLTSSNDLTGSCVANGTTDRSIQILGQTTNDNASLIWRSDTTTNLGYSCSFMYEVK